MTNNHDTNKLKGVQTTAMAEGVLQPGGPTKMREDSRRDEPRLAGRKSPKSVGKVTILELTRRFENAKRQRDFEELRRIRWLAAKKSGAKAETLVLTISVYLWCEGLISDTPIDDF